MCLNKETPQLNSTQLDLFYVGLKKNSNSQ